MLSIKTRMAAAPNYVNFHDLNVHDDETVIRCNTLSDVGTYLHRFRHDHRNRGALARQTAHVGAHGHVYCGNNVDLKKAIRSYQCIHDARNRQLLLNIDNTFFDVADDNNQPPFGYTEVGNGDQCGAISWGRRRAVAAADDGDDGDGDDRPRRHHRRGRSRSHSPRMEEGGGDAEPPPMGGAAPPEMGREAEPPEIEPPEMDNAAMAAPEAEIPAAEEPHEYMPPLSSRRVPARELFALGQPQAQYELPRQHAYATRKQAPKPASKQKRGRRRYY